MSLLKFVRKRREIEDELKALRTDNSHLLEENHELQERLQHENGQLQFDLHECRQEKERLEHEKGALEDNKTQLMNNISGLIRQNNTLQKEASESKDKYLELKSKYDEMKNKLNDVERQKQDLETYASQTEEAIARLSHDRDNLQRQTMELEEDIRMIKISQGQGHIQAVHVTQAQAHSHGQQMQPTSAQLVDLSAKFSREKARLEEEIDNLKEELADRDRSSINKHLELAVNDLTLEKERLQRENNRLMDERRQREKLLNVPKPPLAEREDSVTRELEELITRLTEEKDRLQQENRQLIQHQETSSVSKINIKLEGTVSQLMEERHELEEENQKLRVELEASRELTEETQLLRDELDKARVNAEQFHVQLDHLTSRLEKEQAQVLQSNRNLSEQCENKNRRIEELELEISSMGEVNKKIREQNDVLEKRVREMLEQLQDSSQKDMSDMFELTENVSRLTIENNALKNENQQLQEHHTTEAKQFKEEMERMNNTNKTLQKDKEDEQHDLQALVKSLQDERQELLSKLELQEKDAVKMREEHDLRVFHLHTEKLELEARIKETEEKLSSGKPRASADESEEVKVVTSDGSKESIEQLTAVVNKLKEEKEHLQNQNRELECRNDQISQSLNIEKQKLLEENLTLRHQLGVAQQTSKGSVEQTADGATVDLIKERHELEESNVQLRKEIEQLQALGPETEAALEKNIEILRVENERLKEKLMFLNKELEERVKELTNENFHLQTKLKEVDLKGDPGGSEYIQTIKLLENENVQMRLDFEDVKSKLLRTEEQLASTTFELERLRETSEGEKVQLQERFTDLQTTSMKTIQNLTEKLSASTEECIKLNVKEQTHSQVGKSQVSENQTTDARQNVQTQTRPAKQKEAISQTIGEAHVGEKYDVTLDQLLKTNSSLSEENTELKFRLAEAEALVSGWTQGEGTVQEIHANLAKLTQEKERLEVENRTLRQRQLELSSASGEDLVQSHSEVYFAVPCVVREEDAKEDDKQENAQEEQVKASSSAMVEAEPVGKLDLTVPDDDIQQETAGQTIEQTTEQATADGASNCADDLRASFDRLAERKIILEKENAELRSQFEHFKSHADELEQQLQLSFAMFEAEKERFVSDKKAMSSEYEEVISELSKENLELKRKRAALVEEISNNARDLASLNTRLADDKQRIQGEYDRLEKKYDEHEAQALQTKSQMEISVVRMVNQIEALEKKNKELTDTLSAEDRDAMKYRTDLEETARKLNDETLRIDAMQTDKAHLLDIIRQLENSNRQLSDLLKKYSGDAAKSDTQVRTAVLAMQDEKNRIDKLEKDKFQLMEIMEQYEEQSEILINSLKSDKKRLNEENNDLRTELEEMYTLLRGGENDAIDILAEKEAELAIIKACRSIEDDVFKSHLVHEARMAKEKAAAIERQTNNQIKDQYQSQLDDLERDVFNKDMRNQQLELLLSKVEEELQMEREINEEICKEIQKLQEVSSTGEIEPIVERIMVKKTIAHLTKEDRDDSQDISTTDEEEESVTPEISREERRSIRNIMSGLETLKEESETVDVHRLMEENRLLVKRIREFQTLREENERLTEELHTLRSDGLESEVSQELDTIKRDNQRLLQEMEILRANMEEASEEAVLSMRADIMRTDDSHQESIPKDEVELKKKYQLEDLENKLHECEFVKQSLEEELKAAKKVFECEKHNNAEERNLLNEQITELSIELRERDMSIAMLGQQLENLKARAEDAVETDQSVIHSISHENEILKSKLSESVKLMESERRLKDEMNRKLKEENEKNAELNKEMTTRNMELHNMSLQLTNTDKELEAIQIIAERFERTYANVEETIASLQNENRYLKDTIEGLEQHQTDLEKQLDVLKNPPSPSVLVDESEKRNSKVVELEQEISNLQGFFDDREKLNQTCNELKRLLESKEVELIQTRETSSKECQDLRNKIKQMSEEPAHAQTEQQEKVSPLHTASHEHLHLHEQTHKIEKLERRIKEMEDIIDDLERENDLLRSERTAEEGSTTLRQLVESVSDMPADETTAIEQIRRDSLRDQIAYEKQFQEMDSRILQLHQENASLSEILSKQEMEIACASGISVDDTITRDSPDGEREDLEGKIADLTCETSLLQEMLKQKEEHFMFELEACRRQKDVETKWLQDKVETLEAERSELQTEIMRQQMERTFDDNTESNEKDLLQSKIDDLLKQSTDMTTELSRREQAHAQEIRDMNAEMEKTRSQFDTTVTALSNENRALQEKIKAIQCRPGKNGKNGKVRTEDHEMVDLKRRLEAAKSQKEEVERKFKELKDGAKDQKKKAVDEVRKERSKEFEKVKKELVQRDEVIAKMKVEVDELRSQMESQRKLLENKYSRDHLDLELERLRLDLEKSFSFEMEEKQEELEMLRRRIHQLEKDSSDSERSSGSSRETSRRKPRTPRSPVFCPPSSPLDRSPPSSPTKQPPSPPKTLPSELEASASQSLDLTSFDKSPSESSMEVIKETQQQERGTSPKADHRQSSSGSESPNHDGSYGDVDTKDDDLSGTAEGFSEVRRKRKRRKRKSLSSPK